MGVIAVLPLASGRRYSWHARMHACAAGFRWPGVPAAQAARVRSTWARLIHKVYEVDPLECPRCKGPMRAIALIDDAAVIRKILSHLGLWAPQCAPKRYLGLPAPDPPAQSKPVLTYPSVPDIA